MPAPRWLLPFVGTLALATCSSTVLAAEASRDQSEWPCVQHKVDRLSSAQMWDGPPVEDLTGWREDKTIQKLVPVLTSRRVPIDDARKAIDDFAQSLPEEQRDQKLKLLFAAVLDATNRDRAVVMAGIERFQRRQRERAVAIEKQGAELRDLRASKDVSPAKVAEAQQAYDWAVRVFSERQQAIPLACEVPVLIEQRLFAIAQEIRARMTE